MVKPTVNSRESRSSRQGEVHWSGGIAGQCCRRGAGGGAGRVKDAAVKRDVVGASPNDVWRQCALFSLQSPAQRHAESRLTLYCESLQSFEMFRFSSGSLPQLSHPNASRSSASRAGGSRRCTVYVCLSAWLAVELRRPKKNTLVLGAACQGHEATCATVKRDRRRRGAADHREDSAVGAPTRASMHATFHGGMRVIGSAYGGTVA